MRCFINMDIFLIIPFKICVDTSLCCCPFNRIALKHRTKYLYVSFLLEAEWRHWLCKSLNVLYGIRPLSGVICMHWDVVHVAAVLSTVLTEPSLELLNAGAGDFTASKTAIRDFYLASSPPADSFMVVRILPARIVITPQFCLFVHTHSLSICSNT